MYLSDRILGQSTARAIRARASAPLLQIGSDVFHRGDLAHVECYNFTAAANLSAILNRELRVKNLRDVFEHIPPTTLALPRLGAVSLAVLGAAFEAKGIGGERPLEAWCKRHTDPEHDLMVTFVSLKHRDAAEHAEARADVKLRKHARRSEAHRRRVDRFMRRHKVA